MINGHVTSIQIMNFKFYSIFLLVHFYISNVHCNQSWSNAVDGTCKFTINHEFDIRFEQNPLLFIERLQAKDLSSCRKKCCDHATCNGYVWDANDVSNEQCKLLKCSNAGTDCKDALTKSSILDKANHEVGFITGVADTKNQLGAVLATPTTATTIAASQPLTTTTVYTTTTIQNLLQLAAYQSLKTPSPRKETGIELVADIKKALNITTTNFPLTTVQNKTSSVVTPSTTTLTSSNSSKIVTTHSPTNSSKPVHKKKVKPVYKVHQTTALPTRKGVIPPSGANGHSDNISLIGALFFGLAFLLVIFYLVGKRWMEGMKESHKRRGYTRISYLLNGV